MCVCTKLPKRRIDGDFYKQKITIGGKFVAVRKPILAVRKAGTVSAWQHGPSNGAFGLLAKISRVYEQKKF
jgi:hypothetical protein